VLDFDITPNYFRQLFTAGFCAGPG